MNRSPRIPLLLASLALALLPAACGGEDAPSWTTSSEAMEAAASARSRNDMQQALAAYDWVIESEDALPAQKSDALYARGAIQARTGQVAAAQASFEQGRTKFPDQLTPRKLRDAAEAWIYARDTARAEAAVDLAMRTYPDQAQVFEKVRQGVEALASGNEAALAELGYVGD